MSIASTGKSTFNESMRVAAENLRREARAAVYREDPVLWAEEVLHVTLWSKQKEILRSLAANKRTAVKSCHSIGKDLPLDTPIPTPTGWTTMGEIKQGDYVIDAQGNPTRVMFVSEDMHTVNYELTFSDGTTMIAGADHQWNTLDFKARARIKGRKANKGKPIDWREHWDDSATVTTQQIVDTLHTSLGQGNHTIPAASALNLPEAELPIDPWVLGAWLGDGTSSAAQMCVGDDGQFIIDRFEAAGYKLTKLKNAYVYSFAPSHAHGEAKRKFQDLGVMGAGITKHIPMTYLRASVRQRKELLAGILDTDGFVVNTGSAGIDLANKGLAYGVAELVRSLGVKVNIREGSMSVSGRQVPGTRYRLTFTPDFNPFGPGGHKHANFTPATKQRPRMTGRTVTSARVVPTVTSRCIQVDNPRSLYLAGKDFIPTHNTFVCGIASCWWASTREDSIIQSTAPTYQQVHGQLWEEIRKMHTKAGLRGRVTLGDKWMVAQEYDSRVTDILLGEGKKPADSNIHGFHGTHRPDGVLAILDEGCGIHQSIFTGAEAITTARMDRQLTTGNPDDPNTEFGRIFREGGKDWSLITVSAYDTPKFTGEDKELLNDAKEKDLDPELVRKKNARDGTNFHNPHELAVAQMLKGMPDPEWIASRATDWGEDSPRYLSKVLAQFPETSIDSLYSGADIETGRNNVIETQPSDFKILAVDVARYGTDKTVLALNVKGDTRIVAAYNTMDIMEVAAQVHKAALELKIDQVRVDGIGVGSGVVDRLIGLTRAAGMPYVVVEMTASKRAPDPTLHRNARAYWYDSLKYQLRNGMVSLPTDGPVPGKDPTNYADKLLRELTTIKYSYPNGIMQIESKEDIRKRGGDSPDFVDALVMATAPINNILEDPLSSFQPGQVLEIDVLTDMALMVSYY